MAELVDALVSGTSAARRGGSSPLLGTNFADKAVHLNKMRGFFVHDDLLLPKGILMPM
jgi:hypothetical protein